MRALLSIALLLLAGCAQAPDPDAPPTPGSPAPPPTGDPFPASDECAPFELKVDPAEGIRPGERAMVSLVLRNCGEGVLRATLPYCPKKGEVEARVLAGGRAWYLGGGTAQAELPDDTCETFLREIQQNETFSIDLSWDGTTASCEPGEGCPFGDWLEPGWYKIEGLLRSQEGLVAEDSLMFQLLAPNLPPYENDGDVVLLLDESYARGSAVQVRARNDGDVGYRYRTHYAACDIQYFDERGYPFLVPEGTHCDIANDDVLDPGETVTLFTWGLARCTKDFWGCGASEPLPPGVYHLSAEFHQDLERYWEHPETNTRAGATLRVT